MEGTALWRWLTVDWFGVFQGKVAGYGHKNKNKICKGRNKRWKEVYINMVI